MRLLRLEVTGWAGVDHIVVINPPGPILELWSEAAAQGKSSALEPLLALAGGKARIVEGPSAVRDGHKRAQAVLEWEHEGAIYRAELTVTKSGALSIELTCDGKPVRPPREALAKIFGRLYSPADFRYWDAKAQLAFAGELAGPKWSEQLQELEAAEQACAEERTLANRTLKALGRVEDVPQAEPVDETALAAELAAVEGRNRMRALAAQKRRTAQTEVQRLRYELGDAEKKLYALPIPEPEEDAAPIRDRLTSASRQNAQAQRWASAQKERARHETASRAALEAERLLEDVRGKLAGHRRSAPLPAGLVATDGGLEWLGRPLARASTGEGYRLSLELAAKAGQKLVVQDRAESMDSATCAELEAWCQQKDMVAVLATLGRHHTEGALELRDGRLVTEAEDLDKPF